MYETLHRKRWLGMSKILITNYWEWRGTKGESLVWWNKSFNVTSVEDTDDYLQKPFWTIFSLSAFQYCKIRHWISWPLSYGWGAKWPNFRQWGHNGKYVKGFLRNTACFLMKKNGYKEEFIDSAPSLFFVCWVWLSCWSCSSHFATIRQ